MIYRASPIWINSDGAMERWGLLPWALPSMSDGRTFAQMSAPGRQQGDRSGTAFYEGPEDASQVKDDEAVPLGNLDSLLLPEQKTLLGVSDVRTLGEALLVRSLWSEFPPALKRGGFIEWKLRERRVSMPMRPGLDGWDRVQARLKAEVLSAPVEKQAALITDRLQKLGLPATREKAHEYLDLDREPGVRETTKGDTFNRGTDVAITSHTSTGANGGDSYTALTGSSMRVDNGGASGRAYCSGNITEARLNGDMSSVDFETEFNAQFLSAVTGRYIGAMTRKDSTATRTFMAAFFAPDRSPDQYTIVKCVSGAYSDLATANTTFSADVYHNLRFRSDDSDHTLWDDDVQVLTVNDGSVFGGTRGGMVGGSGSGATFITMQNLLITDELALAQEIEPTGIGATESVGSVAIGHGVTLSGAGSDEAAGSVTIGQAITLSGAGSDEALGTIVVGEFTLVQLGGIGSIESLGTITIGQGVTLSGAGSDEAAGSVAIGQAIGLSGAGSDAAPGAIVVGEITLVQLGGISSTESAGSVTISQGVTLSGAGSDEAAGSVTIGQAITLAGAGVEAAPGAVAVALDITISLSSASADGSPGSVNITEGSVGGYNVYSRSTIDGEDTLLIFLPAGNDQHIVTGLAESEQWVHVKAVSPCGIEDDEPIRLKRVAFDADGNLILPVPNPPLGLRLVCGADGEVTARWTYIPNGQGAEPALFNVYVATGEDEIDLLTVTDTVTYSAARTFSVSLGEFADGTAVKCIVRAEAASGAEEHNTVEVETEADAQAPTPATSLQVEVTAS